MSLLYNLIELAACFLPFIFFFLLTEKLYLRSAKFSYPILVAEGIVITLLGFMVDAILPNIAASLLILLAEFCFILHLYNIHILQAVLTVLFLTYGILSLQT